MEQGQLEKLRAWFEGYVRGFYGEDEYVNANIALKDKHSRATCGEILYLADKLAVIGDRRRLAEALGLLHDVGRFEQFVRYRTYNDPRSVDHGLLGLEVLRKNRVLEGLDDGEREIIEKAIEYHGWKQLPEDLDGEVLFFSRLLRDADKLDIYRVVIEYYQQYRERPEEFRLEIEYPDEPRCSAEVVEKLLRGQAIGYDELRTLNDVKLCQIAWVYDVNFGATLKRIRQRGFLEKIFDFLPDDEDIKKMREKVFEYVETRIKKDT
jgi:hypothetical protein